MEEVIHNHSIISNMEPKDIFSQILVFDDLEVGPVTLSPNRLTAPYRLSWQGGSASTELVYRYEEDVFDHAEPESVNMANMIAAQAAINYGLFCKTVVFHGSYDELDRRLIRDMAENTAREIYVKKILSPNPFLLSEYSGTSPEKRPNYLQSKIVFSKGKEQAKVSWHLWNSRKDRHCVLSSGGKDSLLTYGLLNELGLNVHPIFVNESGRHWFTALNAYRYFKENVPNTARVWVNSDRLFSWMLKQMPFIRKDFSSIRSDAYPIRLWTVAVFIFGVLPLLRKRGIGRLLIGDEYDTTVRTTYHGITHYDGLYDQSLYFDQTLSRYFMRKGWAISQFSVLRPISELLIEKTLAERYPKLLAHQVSCHMAHERDQRIYPCGRCEKCRRIVSMLTAIGKAPEQCGYEKQQIQSCLKDFLEKGISQEEAGVQHIGNLLYQKKLIDLSEEQQRYFQEKPEIFKLRFNSKSAPINGTPNDLRKPLWTILLKHAAGTLENTGKAWREIDLFTDVDIDQPYPFELDTPDTHAPSRRPRIVEADAHPYIWGELSRPEAERYLQQVDIALLPVGAIEQHGPHLPLDTDTFDANYLARRVAEASSDPKPLVLPPIAYGVSYHHDDFKGTLSISNHTLASMVYDIGIAVARNGIHKLVIINGHGGNAPTLNYAAQMIHRDSGIFVCVDTGETSDVDLNTLIETPNDVHAGELETSTALAVRPHLVRMDLAVPSVPKFSSRYLDFTSKRGVEWYAFTNKLSPNGVMGDPTKASAEKGSKLWEMMVAHLVNLIEDLKPLTLEEIYGKKIKK